MFKHLIVIPAYNEEASIGRVLKKLQSLQLQADILVVNDGSIDRTSGIAEDFGVAVITHPINLGYGAALQTGFQYAVKRNYDFVIQFDADGQHSPGDLPQFMDTLAAGKADVVIGSRYLGDSTLWMGWAKKMVITFFRFLIYLLTKAQITDPTSGFRGLNRRVFEAFAMRGSFPSDYPDSNLLIHMILHQYRIVEVPVSMNVREQGESMHAGFKPVFYLFQVLLSILIVVLRYRLLRRGDKG
jgi:glycosyltransferase involved in cell wall biosynthesis